MKKLIVSLLPSAALFLFACNPPNTGNQHDSHHKAAMEKQQETALAGEGIKELKVNYSHVDPNAAIVIKESFSHYMHIQHALAGYLQL